MNIDAKLTDINFFISSTYIDMREYRDIVIKNLQSKAGVINAQEFFGTRDKSPLETCLEEVTKSKVFVMFLGARYGSIDPNSGKSFVELEYERARELKLPTFAYLIDESQPIPFKYVSIGDDAQKLAEFKNRVKSELTISNFTTPDDLANKVYSDLIRELPKRGFVIGKESSEEEQASTLKIIGNFLLLPKLYYGESVSFKVRFGQSERASVNECDALSYIYGAAVKRRIELVDPILRRALGTANQLFAHGELAPKLLNQPSGKEFYLTAKTVQGEYTLSEAIYDFERESDYLESIAARYVGRKRVVVGFKETNKLISGLEFLEVAPD